MVNNNTLLVLTTLGDVIKPHRSIIASDATVSLGWFVWWQSASKLACLCLTRSCEKGTIQTSHSVLIPLARTSRTVKISADVCIRNKELESMGTFLVFTSGLCLDKHSVFVGRPTGIVRVVDKEQRLSSASCEWLKEIMALNEMRLLSDAIKREAATVNKRQVMRIFSYKSRSCLFSSHFLTWITPLIWNTTFLTFLLMLSLQPFHVGMFIQQSKGMNDSYNLSALLTTKKGNLARTRNRSMCGVWQRKC